LIYFPPGTEMVHFPGLTRTRLCIQRAVTWFYQDRFPYSEIPGSKPACGSPRLIAACHVLLRLLVPRHPPYALSSLTIKLTQHVSIPRRIETLKTIATNGLASHPGMYFRGDALFQLSFRNLEIHALNQCEASSPFHIALLSSKNLRFITPCDLEIA
jgi:hypothetical protein